MAEQRNDIVVSGHAVARFRERFPDLCRMGPSDESIVAAIRACLAGPCRESAPRTGEGGGTYMTIRTQVPFALRLVVRRRQGCDEADRDEVVTVLRGGATRGDRAGQKARRAAREAAALSAGPA